jgi:hypothetical protein
MQKRARRGPSDLGFVRCTRLAGVDHTPAFRANRGCSPAIKSGAVQRKQVSGLTIRLRRTLADQVRVPSEVSVHVIADAPVALVDHARAERSGFDQLQRDVLGDRRQERGAATDDDRIAEHAKLID